MPGWLHWQAGDGNSGVQLPLAKTSATSAGTLGTENQQTVGCTHLGGLRNGAPLWACGFRGGLERGGSQVPSRHKRVPAWDLGTPGPTGQSPDREAKARKELGPG